MGYNEALEMAGAEIIAMDNFGSYQGDWWALVTYNNTTGWVHGYFGSCSGCDSFEGEFGDVNHEHEDDDYYYNPVYSGFDDGCSECQTVKERLINFGKEYLEGLLTQDKAIEVASTNLEWDADAREMVNFIKEEGEKFEAALRLGANQ